MPQTVRPAAVAGPMTTKNARVIWDDNRVAVVDSRSTRYFSRTADPIASTLSGKTTIPTTEGNLVAVKQGGCACGKPWLSKPSAMDILAAAP